MIRIRTEKLVHLCLDEQGLQQKPKESEGYIIGGIVNRLPERDVYISIQQLASEITLPNAKSFNPAAFKESTHLEKGFGLWMQNEGWAEQQIFAVDIDGGLSFTDAMDRCRKYSLEPAFVYTTFSETNLDKFRLVFCLPESIKDVHLHKMIMKSLVDFFFPEADKKCKNPSRLFFGGKSLIYENYDATIDIHEIINTVCHYVTDREPTNANKQIFSYCQAVGLNTVNKKPEIIKETKISSEIEILPPNSKEYTKTQQYIYYYNRFCGVLVNFYTLKLSWEITKNRSNVTGEHKYSISDKKVKRKKLRNIKLEKVIEKCKLTREFVSGEYWAYHKELFGVATNLLCMQGGQKLFIKGLDNRPEYSAAEGKFKKQDFTEYYLNQINKSNYKAEYCKEYCPFESECNHLSTIIETVSSNRGEVKQLVKTERVNIEEAERLLQDAFEKCQLSEKRINVIKAETGLGKTESFIRSGIKKYVYAVPTHELQNEIAERYRNNGIPIEVTPEVPELEEYEEAIRNRYYQMGAYEKAGQYLYMLSRKNEEYNQKITAYYEELDRVINSNGIIITTHERAILSFKEYDGPIIFDEDPIESQLKINHVSINDLIIFKQALIEVMTIEYDASLIDTIDKIIKYLQNLPNNEHHTYSWESIDFERIKNKAVDMILTLKTEFRANGFAYLETTNIFEFFKCNFFIKDCGNIYYITKRKLPGQKVIVMSATASEYIYKRMYADDLQFIDIPKVVTKGRLIQYPRYSLSRSQLKDNPVFLDNIKAIVSNDKVITYKMYKENFINCVGTYGAVRGLDWLKGEDISIVGTPHVNPIVYYLMGLCLDIEYTDEEAKMYYKNIEYNGYSFYFYTFTNNEGLKEIQMWKVGSEIEQAVGRSRILREDCTVTIYTNYPIQGAEFREILEVHGWVDAKEKNNENDYFFGGDGDELMVI